MLSSYFKTLFYLKDSIYSVWIGKSTSLFIVKVENILHRYYVYFNLFVDNKTILYLKYNMLLYLNYLGTYFNTNVGDKHISQYL